MGTALSKVELYVGGFFSQAGGVSANSIAKWDGNSWSSLGRGVVSVNFGVGVSALAVSGSDLYAGGDFIGAGDILAKHVAKWNGSSWEPLGSGLGENSGVNTLAVSGGELYAGGGFGTVGGTTISNIAKWNGSSWSPLGGGVNATVNALAFSGSDLYVGGAFSIAGGNSASRIAKWNGANWAGFGNGSGNGVSGSVNCLLLSGNDLYVGGSFSAAGNVPVNNIAKWNGTSWAPLGSGVRGQVNALALSGNDLYVGGFFSQAGGIPANNIAKWNGSSWAPLGGGIENGEVFALAINGNELYVGGTFQTAGGLPASRIAKWNGTSWAPLGSGLNGELYALAVSGSDLYVGGYFTTAGGAPANRIAQWNGNSWLPLSSGLDGAARALAVNGNDLYVGGQFTTAGGTPVNYIAKWNGNNWAQLGGGVNSLVFALAFKGADLYVGGGFTMAGATPANAGAKWNGSSWTPLGSGLDKNVFALALNASDLYVGGAFSKAGNKPSAFIGRYSLIDAPPTIVAVRGLARPNTSPAQAFNIATVNDNGDLAVLAVRANGATTATVNGVTLSNITMNALGQVSANIATAINASDATFTLRVTDGTGLFAEAPLTVAVNTPAGPGTLAATTSPLSAQRPGSVLIYNVFTSSAAAPNQQNTRLSLTNTHPVNKSYVHLFFVDGASCSVADGFVCLTPNQTTSFLASDLDPGTSGYVIAVAVDALGCPISFNHLIGDEFVKFSSGHAANLGAEAATAIAGGLPLCDGNSPTAELRFDGLSYSVLPHVLGADNLGSRADGNDTLLILNRIGGSLATGAATLGSVFGILYDDAEAPISFSFAQGTCQLRSVISGNSIRTVPRYEQFIPAGRTGWLKVSATNLGAMTGAVLNANPNATAQSGAFNQGHNLHKLTTTNTAALTIPVFPPGC